MRGPAHDVREALASHLSHRSFRAGTVLWREGDRDGMLVLVERGRIKIFRTVQGARELPLFVFGPGDLFGFMPLLDGSPYPASAVALGDVDARVLSRSGLERALAHDPRIARVLISALSQRLRSAMSQIELLGMRGAMPRVAAMLSALVDDAAPEPQVLVLPLKARELAEVLNLTPPTLSRALSELEETGAVHKLAPGRYQLLDRPLLASLADRVTALPLGSML